MVIEVGRATLGPGGQVKVNSSLKCNKMHVKKSSDFFRHLMRVSALEMVLREQPRCTEVGVISHPSADSGIQTLAYAHQLQTV